LQPHKENGLGIWVFSKRVANAQVYAKHSYEYYLHQKKPQAFFCLSPFVPPLHFMSKIPPTAVIENPAGGKGEGDRG